MSVTPPPGTSAPAIPAAPTAADMRLPGGAVEATWFQLYNALSWQITLGAPAIVYAKSLGASATVLGVMAALTPLLTVFQLPATPLLARYGYKRFLLLGWGSRTVTIFLMAGVPLIPGASDPVRLWTLVALLGAFNFLRGVASGAWWPWISELIPEHLRGRYLSREQAFIQLGGLIAMMLAAAILGRESSPHRYAVVFLISALSQTTSLLYVRRIPEAAAEDRRDKSGRKVPWRQIVTWPPFLRLVTFNVIYQAAAGGIAVFTIAFMRTRAGFSENTVMALVAVGILGALSTVTWVGRLLDREGSRPVLRACLVAYVLLLSAWWAVSAGALPTSVPLVALIQLATGTITANFTVANNRLATLTIPAMGRDHFFAAYSVITNFAMGLSPILWGVVLDLIGPDWQRATGAVTWTRYGIFFSIAAFLAALAFVYTNSLSEAADKTSPRPGRTDRQ